LIFDSFKDDRQEVVHRARKVPIIRILTPAIDLETSHAAVQLAERYPEVYAAVGIHPNSCEKWAPHSLDELRRLAQHSKVVAIGEIGLDYYRNPGLSPLQRDIFRAQLSLAAELNLPVIIHNRDAIEDLFEILEKWVYDIGVDNIKDRPGVIHSFSGSDEIAEHILSLGFYIGISGPVTFKSARDLQEVVRFIDLDRVLIETDAPFLTPHPHRGKRNEPGYVIEVARKIAELRSLSLSMVAETTTANAERLFRWREIV
jgi:TatD DNase family protein